MNRIIFVNGQVFDGTGTPPVPADAVVRSPGASGAGWGGGSDWGEVDADYGGTAAADDGEGVLEHLG